MTLLALLLFRLNRWSVAPSTIAAPLWMRPALLRLALAAAVARLIALSLRILPLAALLSEAPVFSVSAPTL